MPIWPCNYWLIYMMHCNRVINSTSSDLFFGLAGLPGRITHLPLIIIISDTIGAWTTFYSASSILSVGISKYKYPDFWETHFLIVSKKCCYIKETVIVYTFIREGKIKQYLNIKINILSTNYLIFSQCMSIKNRYRGEKEVSTVSLFPSSRVVKTTKATIFCLLFLGQHTSRTSYPSALVTAAEPCPHCFFLCLQQRPRGRKCPFLQKKKKRNLNLHSLLFFHSFRVC